MQGTSGNHFAGEAEPRTSQIPWNPQWHAYPPLTTASRPAVWLQGTFWQGMWAAFMLSMWLPLCHVGSTSDRSRSSESLVRIRNLHLLYRRESSICLVTRLMGIFLLWRWLGLLVGCWLGWMVLGPALSPLSPFLSFLLLSPTWQSCKKIIERVLLLVPSECVIQERNMVLFGPESIIGSSATDQLVKSSWEVSFGCYI